jgi:hypothetical protein
MFVKSLPSARPASRLWRALPLSLTRAGKAAHLTQASSAHALLYVWTNATVHERRMPAPEYGLKRPETAREQALGKSRAPGWGMG